MIETLYNNIFPNNCMIRKSTIYLSLPLFLSTGKQFHFDCSDVSRILPDGNMSGLKNPDKKPRQTCSSCTCYDRVYI